jgi:hypothetical protein
MKKIFALTLIASILTVSLPAVAQKKVALTDKAQFLTPGIETSLRDRLKADSLDLTSIIDTRIRCDYWFTTLSKTGNELLLSVLDCNDKPAGTKNLGTRIFSATDSEKALLVYFALSEIIKNPYKNSGENISVPVQAVPASTQGGEATLPDPGQHRTRYFFAPSSYSLEKGELYYNSLYFLIHDVQYGINDKFSLGMGTTIIGFPFYLTPKLTIPLNDKSAFAIGDLLMIGTWGAKFTGNLFYGTYTRGGAYNNFTLGGGYLYINTGDITYETNAAVFNFSALAQFSSHIYFITENYSSRVKTKQIATYSHYDEPTNTYIYYDEDFRLNMFFFYGSAGFRFINRTKDVKSFQIGLSYVFTSFEDIPAMYQRQFWTTDRSGKKNSKFIAFPVIGYARKFSTKF